MIRTLIVDDDFMVAAIHREYTERIPGFEVVGVAHTARDALAGVERLGPDLVVLDIYLPDLSGLAVLDRLRQGPGSVDVIMVTAAKDAQAILQAMHGGALHYIVKPFDFPRFRQTLESYRRFRQQREALAATRAMEQRDVDRLFTLRSSTPTADLPKGLDPLTLERILRRLREAGDFHSASEVAEGIGISRGTARRYLEYLEQTGRVVVDLRYGATGRPEHLYRLPESPTDPSSPFNADRPPERSCG